MTSSISKNVMRRVHTIHAVRPFLSATALMALVFLLALWGIGREVWVARVLANGPQGLFGHVNYLAYAFAHTRFVVQALVVVALAAFTYMCVDAVRRIGPTARFA